MFWSCQEALQWYCAGVIVLVCCIDSLVVSYKQSWSTIEIWLPLSAVSNRRTLLMPFQLQWLELCTHSRFPFTLVLWYITALASLCLWAVGFCCIFSLWMIMVKKFANLYWNWQGKILGIWFWNWKVQHYNKLWLSGWTQGWNSFQTLEFEWDSLWMELQPLNCISALVSSLELCYFQHRQGYIFYKLSFFHC